jgi:hypothetical protein
MNFKLHVTKTKQYDSELASCDMSVVGDSVIITNIAFFDGETSFTHQNEIAIPLQRKDADVATQLYIVKNNSTSQYDIMLDEVLCDGIDSPYKFSSTSAYSRVHQIIHIYIPSSAESEASIHKHAIVPRGQK